MTREAEDTAIQPSTIFHAMEAASPFASLREAEGAIVFRLDGHAFTVVIERGAVTVKEGAAPGAQASLECDARDFVDSVVGRRNAATMLMRGAMRLSGDVALAVRFSQTYPQIAERLRALADASKRKAKP